MRAPTLVIGYGNPSRGDDALGPQAVAEIERLASQHPEWGAIEVLTDFQLQVEFVTDLADRRRILFIDAAANGTEPFSFVPLAAKPDASVTSHALSPAGLLAVYRDFHQAHAAPSRLLGIRGYDFELGAPVSARAQRNLDAALKMLQQWLAAKGEQAERAA